jgi:hypothetical protein
MEEPFLFFYLTSLDGLTWADGWMFVCHVGTLSPFGAMEDVGLVLGSPGIYPGL